MSPSPIIVRRFFAVAFLLTLGLVADAILNHLNVHGLADPLRWVYPRIIPTLGEPGTDLRILMHGAEQLAQGINPYSQEVAYPPPPFAAVVFYPFTLLAPHTAFLVQYAIIIAFNLASIALIARCLVTSSQQRDPSRPLPFSTVALASLVVLVTLCGQFHSYGLEFAAERGNFDSYVLVASASAIACMIAWPERVWMPVILLSAAAHLKIYPAILLVLPLLQSWRKALVPLVLVNTAMLFVFGTSQAAHFFAQIFGYMAQPYVWPGNHSVAAYVAQVVVPLFSPRYAADAVQTGADAILSLMVAGLWLHGMIRLWSVKPLSRRWLLIAALSFPVMGALSSTSHDYKLVIYVLPILVNLYVFSECALADGSLSAFVGVALTLLCALCIDHSSVLPPWPLLETKFPAILALLGLGSFQAVLACDTADTPADEARARRKDLRRLGTLAAACVAALLALPVTRRLLVGKSPPRPHAAAVAEAPAAPLLPAYGSGFGAVTLQIKLPGTFAGIPEPLLVCGRPGQAALVYIRLLTNARAKVGIEFWGLGSMESDPFPVLAQDAYIEITCLLPCLFPGPGDPAWKVTPASAREDLGRTFSITVNDVVRLKGPVAYPQSPPVAHYYGHNPVGGSLVSDRFTGMIVSAYQKSL